MIKEFLNRAKWCVYGLIVGILIGLYIAVFYLPIGNNVGVKTVVNEKFTKPIKIDIKGDKDHAPSQDPSTTKKSEISSNKTPYSVEILGKPVGIKVHPKLFLSGVDVGAGIGIAYINKLDLNLSYFPRCRQLGIGLTYPIFLRRGLFVMENLQVGMQYQWGNGESSWTLLLALPF